MCPLNKNYLNNVYYNTPQIKEVELEWWGKKKKKDERSMAKAEGMKNEWRKEWRKEE